MIASSPPRYLLSLLAVATMLLVSGCSTVSSRIEKNPEIFSSLPPAQKVLVQQGRIDNGMAKEAVYLAWGRPSTERFESDTSGNYETWIYVGNYQEPVQTFGYIPTGCRYRGYSPAFETTYVNVPYLDRSATFSKNHVIGFQTSRRGY